MGGLDSVDAVCRALANASGARVASIDYRLAPEHPYPAAVEDALAAVRALEGDLAVAGDSAGGNLAAVVARRLRERIKLQLLIYPVTDAGVNTPSFTEFSERHGLTAAAMQRFWNLYLNGADGLHPDASPLRADDLAGVAPAYVVTASHDVLRDEGEAYAAALERAGVPVTLKRLDGTIHGFWRWQTTAIARQAVAEAGAAVRAALG
jgi:acetyl esterase